MRKKAKIVLRYNLEGFNDFYDIFKSKYSVYQMSITKSSVQLTTENYKYLFTKDYIGIGAIILFQRVKSDILKNIEEKKIEIPDNIIPNYFTYNPKYFDSKSGYIIGCTELDLNSAYLNTAYRLNLISDEIYNKLLSCSKNIRLRALGSIATKKDIYSMENGSIAEHTEKKNDLLCNVWKLICSKTDETIYELIAENGKDSFVFYWFDNLFINRSQNEIRKDRFYKLKFPLDMDYNYINNNIVLRIRQTEKTFNFSLK